MVLSRNLLLILIAAFLRALGIGLSGVVLGIYLARAGYSATLIGLVVAAGFAGITLAMLFVSFRADRLGRRATLVALALLLALGGAALAFTTSRLTILLLSFVGMVNGMGRDRGPAFALEQAMIPEAVPAERRTAALAVYNLVMDVGSALGALGAMVPLLLRNALAIPLLSSYQRTFVLYVLVNLGTAALYGFLSPQVEAERTDRKAAPSAKVSLQSKKIIAKLAGVISLDGLGGGFLTGALMAYWFFRRFGAAEGSLGPIFFAARILNGSSYFAAVWLARRIGLLNTMVSTHIPSSLVLIAVAAAPKFSWAVGLFLVRECLVQMDVPTRQSYTLAVVGPAERTYASGLTHLTRNVAWAGGSSAAGYVMQHVTLATPLFLGAGLKIVYDVILFFAFRRLKPPEEQAAG